MADDPGAKRKILMKRVRNLVEMEDAEERLDMPSLSKPRAAFTT